MVLVSHTHKLIFLKTRKTAGTSVEMLLEAATGLGPNPPVESRPARVDDKGAIGFRMWPTAQMTDLDRLWRPHIPARKLRKLLGKFILDTYLKIACIRNPFDRVISHFHWGQQFLAPQDRSDGAEGFAEFVRSDWHDDRNIVMIGEAFVPDMTIRFEHLKDDIANLAKTTGLPLDPAQLPVTKALGQKRLGPPLSYYTEDLAQIVRTRLAWMFEAGGYAQTVPDGQMVGAQ